MKDSQRTRPGARRAPRAERPSIGRRRGWRAAAIAGVGLAVAVLTGWWGLRCVSLPPTLFEPSRAGIDLTDRHGRPLRALPSDGGYGGGVEFGQIPETLVRATVAAEDRRFWRHPGVDAFATARAAVALVRHRRVVSGASTITQQLIKLASPRPRTAKTKVIEAVQALRLEQVWTKQEILTAYLNRLDYGNLCLGCDEAARFYFAKPLADLTVAEAAFLAGLPQAPSRLNPHRNPAAARKRQEWILQRLRDTGQLESAEYDRARLEPLRLVPPRRAFHAPHFTDLVLAQGLEGASRSPRSEQRVGTEGVTAGGERIEIRTSLDLELNRVADRVLRGHLARLEAQHVQDGAVVILANRTGEVLALVGSGDYFGPRSGQVNGAWARRSAGSTFKPFTYLLAFEQGATAASIVADVPGEFMTATGVFRPANYHRRCHGPLRYRLALANSLNLPAVRVLAAAGGPEPLARRLREFGLTTLDRPADHYGLGLTLGNAEVRLVELANAYAGLARLGVHRPLQFLALDPSTTLPPPGRRVAPADAAWLVADILADNAARGLAFGAESPLRFDFPVACKTGTSSDFRDNWALGFTPEFTVGVWVGNFDGTPMSGVSGVTGAAPILHELFEYLHTRHGTSWYVPPPDAVGARVHPLTGHRLTRPRPGGVREWFLAGRLTPEESSTDYDPSGAVRLGPEYSEWLASPDNGLGRQVVLQASKPALRVLRPLPDAVYYLNADLPESGRWLRLEAEGPPDLAWQSPSLELRRDRNRDYARLVPGEHVLTVSDPVTSAQRTTRLVVRER